MNICYLHQYFNTPSMTGGIRSYEMARRLVAAGHSVNMITTDRTASERPVGSWYQTQEAGINVHWVVVPYSNKMSYAQRTKAFFQFALAAGKKAAAIGGDVVFATSTPLTIAIPAVKASRKNGIPMVFEVRDLWPELPIAMGALRNPAAIAAARWLERYAYRHSAQIVALSPGMKDGVVAAGYPEDKVTVIPNSCDFELFQIDAQAGLEVRRKHDWLGDRPLVIYTGTVGKINGVDYLVRLAANLQSIDPEVRFLVIAKESSETQKIATLATELGVFQKSFYILPPVPKKDVPAWLSAATMTTSTFIDLKAMWANSANKFFDSLAAGRPIAINYGGWQAELIRDYNCGLVLDPHDTASAAQQLARHLRDQAWLSSASRNASRLGRERFDRNKLAVALEEVLLKAVGTSKVRG